MGFPYPIFVYQNDIYSLTDLRYDLAQRALGDPGNQFCQLFRKLSLRSILTNSLTSLPFSFISLTNSITSPKMTYVSSICGCCLYQRLVKCLFCCKVICIRGSSNVPFVVKTKSFCSLSYTFPLFLYTITFDLQSFCLNLNIYFAASNSIEQFRVVLAYSYIFKVYLPFFLYLNMLIS